MSSTSTKVDETHGDLFSFERALRSQGFVNMVGIDEAGRGPLAGPVVAAAVRMPASWYATGLPPELEGIHDSKRLSPKKRKKLFQLLTQHSGIQFGIGVVEADEIDVINILKATHKAMKTATALIVNPDPDHALVDGLPVQGLSVPHTAIVKGDSKSYSIAAASIIAKEHRDRLMLECEALYPEYGFAKHKGYGTAAHREAILKHGPCPIHRDSFLGNLRQQQILFSW